MSRPLPERINPKIYAEHGKSLQGTFDLARFTRLQEAVDKVLADISVSLSFAEAGRKLATLRGEVSVPVTVCCQRCLEPLEIDLRSTPMLALVDDEAIETGLTDDWEKLTLLNEPLDLVQLVEDELLMQLPDFPKHAEGQCRLVKASAISGTEQKSEESQKENPFALLKEQFKSGD